MASHVPAAAGPARPPTVYYRDYFTDANRDVFGGDYTALLKPYVTPIGVTPTHSPQDCRTLAFDARSQGVPTAFLLQHNDDNKLHIYIQLDRVTPRMGMAATGWENRTFLGKGELRHNQHVMVEFKDSYWSLTTAVNTGDDATIDNALIADTDAQILGPFNASDAGTVQRRARYTVVVPPAYVPLFLTAPLSPRQAWELVRAQIVADGRDTACEPLIDYLRLALTIVNTGDTESPISITPPTAPLADNFLLDRRHSILQQDFPSLNTALASIHQNQIANELHTLVTVTQNANTDANARRLAAQNKTPTDLLGATGSITLQRYSHQNDINNVANVWTLMANSKKSQHLNIWQWEVNRVKELLNELQLQFVVEASVVEVLKSLQWPMLTNDSVSTGFSAWLLPESDVSNDFTAQAVYEMLYGDGASPSLSDAAALVRAKPGAPKHLYQARLQIRKFHILNVVALDISHALCVAIQTYYNRFLAMESQLHQLQLEDFLLPTKLLKRFCVQCSQWYKRQAATPNFDQVFDDIENERPWAPLLSLPFLTSLGLQAFHDSNRPMQAPKQQGRDSTRGTTLQDGGLVSGDRVNNSGFEEALFGRYRAMPVTCKTIRQRISRQELPALPFSKVDKQPMCLAWHTKGQCNRNCSRVTDHISYTKEEYKPLATWCATNFQE